MASQYYEIQVEVLGQWTTDPIGPNNQFDSESEAEAALACLLETNPSWAIGNGSDARGYRVRGVLLEEEEEEEEDEYTYTIFDANPDTSSGTAWTDAQDVPFTSTESGLDVTCREHLDMAAAGAVDTDRVWILVWDADGTIVFSGSQAVESDENDEPSVPDMAAARKWAREAEAGEYLVEYEDDGLDDVSDPGSMCGFGADEIAEIETILAKRDLKLTADDRGLVAEQA